MLPGCFHLLDELPDTVYRVCDLIMTAIKRNGADYRDMILKQVVNQVDYIFMLRKHWICVFLRYFWRKKDTFPGAFDSSWLHL